MISRSSRVGVLESKSEGERKREREERDVILGHVFSLYSCLIYLHFLQIFSKLLFSFFLSFYCWEFLLVLCCLQWIQCYIFQTFHSFFWFGLGRSIIYSITPKNKLDSVINTLQQKSKLQFKLLNLVCHYRAPHLKYRSVPDISLR